MTETNFMTAKTQIEALAAKREEINKKVAALISEALISREKKDSSKGVTSEREIKTLISDFSQEDQISILIKALQLVAVNGKFGVVTKEKTETVSRPKSPVGGKMKRSNMFGNGLY